MRCLRTWLLASWNIEHIYTPLKSLESTETCCHPKMYIKAPAVCMFAFLCVSHLQFFKSRFDISLVLVVMCRSLFSFLSSQRSLTAITQFPSFIASFGALKWVYATFFSPHFHTSPIMKYLLTESKRFVRRDLKTPAMMDRECFFWHKVGLKATQSVINCCGDAHRLATWQRSVVNVI